MFGPDALVASQVPEALTLLEKVFIKTKLTVDYYQHLKRITINVHNVQEIWNGEWEYSIVHSK